MAETTASDTRLDIPPKDAQQAASSHDSVERSNENESGRTSAAPRKFGCWCILYLVILVLVALPFIPVALLIWCLYELLAKLICSKGVSSQKSVDENVPSHNAVESSHETKPGDTGTAAARQGFCSGRCSFILCAAVLLLILVALIIWCPFWLLSKLLFIKGVSSPRQVAENLNLKSGDTGFNPEKLGEKIHGLVNEGAAAANWRLRILLLLLLSLVIVVSVPGLKRIKVLGLPLWIWMVIPTLLIFSYHYISLLGQSIANEWKETAVVYYLDGLRRSGYWFTVCVVILLAWELYFWSPRHGLRRYGVSKKVHHIGTSLAISLLVGAILALVKNWLILLWESHTTYHRCTGKIRKVGLQLYFLCLVHGIRVDIFSPDEEIPEEAANIKNSDSDEKKLSTYVKKHMAKYFIEVAKWSSREDDTIGTIPNKIREEWEKFQARGSDGENKYITKESVKEKLKHGEPSDKNRVKENLQDDKLKNDINVFFKKLRNEDESEDKKRKNADELKDKASKKTDKPKGKETKDREPKNADEPKNTNEPEEKISEGQDSASTDKIPYETFKEWMTKAFINCVSFGYTLMDAQSATKKLDIIMTVFLVIVAILCFLFLTNIASTKVLVTIWSVIAAATFIFGDMLKAWFEGIIFVFVMNPFDVGDWCIIDNTQLEVKSIDVLKTTFRSIHNKEEVLYPNKVLAGKTISNFKWHLNNEDYLELSLTPTVGIIALQDQINRFFEEHSKEFKDHSVMTKEVGELIKIAIHFKHDIQDDTHLRYFKKKNEQRSKLLKKVVEHIETKESSSTNNIETKRSS